MEDKNCNKGGGPEAKSPLGREILQLLLREHICYFDHWASQPTHAHAAKVKGQPSPVNVFIADV